MLTQEAESMKYIWRNTTIPVPRIYAYSATLNNDVDCPYIIMSRLPGKSAANIWLLEPYEYDAPSQMTGTPSLDAERKRLNFLRSLATQMTKLKELRFDPIGMPTLGHCEDSETQIDLADLPVGHTYAWPYSSDVHCVEERPTCGSTSEYIFYRSGASACV
jgi:hypothetical protein